MGQYHILVNLDRREYIDPHKLACGLKQWEQLANHPGTGAALLVLLASHSTGMGGGDFKKAADDTTIGRWRGDRIAMVGDYDDEITYRVSGESVGGAEIYSRCGDNSDVSPEDRWADVSEAVCAVIERELDGKYKGDGWRKFVIGTEAADAA